MVSPGCVLNPWRVGREKRFEDASLKGTKGQPSGSTHTQETYTDSPTACTSCSSAQWRLILPETTNNPLHLLPRSGSDVLKTPHNNPPFLTISPWLNVKLHPHVNRLHSHLSGGTLCLSHCEWKATMKSMQNHRDRVTEKYC